MCRNANGSPGLESLAKRWNCCVCQPPGELRERPAPQGEGRRRAECACTEQPSVIVQLRRFHSPQLRAQARLPEWSLVQKRELGVQAGNPVSRASNLQPQKMILHVAPVLGEPKRQTAL